MKYFLLYNHCSKSDLRFVKDFEMNIEEEDIEDSWYRDQTNGSCDKMFEGVTDGFWQVAQNVPQLFDSVCTDKQDDKKTDKFDRKCTS